ncbi:MAG: GAF domain-containing sensor histidine kinase [Comamonadaceae bacterium]|nr:MAG: GAF domain-containing sensor histidine kinase [Comamonadaceae bacterium]
MQSAPLTPGEARRLDILDSLGVVDTPADPVLDGIVRAAAELTGCPVSLVSLVDDLRQWFKARHGLDVQQTPRELAFCAHAILQTELFEVNDARLDTRFVGNPLVTGDPHVVFYAGVPLSVEGHSMGTLCVIDHAPRQLSAAQRHTLIDLARAAEHWLQTQLTVTEKRRLTEELERHQLHLEHLVEQRTAALVEARRAAEAASEAKSAFLATMSHEIRTPMNGVVGSLDLLQHSELTAYQRDLIDTVCESAMGLLTIIDDILDFSKIEAGQLKLQSEAVSLVRLTDSVCNALRSTATSQGVDLQVDVAPGLPDWILSDGTRLRQILNNLLGNAIKFSAGMGRAGRVVLRVQPCGPDLPGHLELSVVDNGIGMTPEVMQRIFQPFVQAESATTRRFGGTGLGLSICKRLAGLMGGWVKADSEAGQGSTFTVILPFQPTSAPQRMADDKLAMVTRTGPHFVPSGGPLVLVAEDNSVNQKVIGHQLALLGLSVEMVSDGLEALALWRAGRTTQRHALLLTDLHMPGIDGYTLATTIRGEETGESRLPIVALSANALNGEIERCRSAGMDDYLSKPVRTDQLGEMVKRWLPANDAPTSSWFGAVDCEEVDVLEVELGPCVYDDQALARLVGDEPELLAEFRQRFVVAALNTVDEMRRAASSGNTVTLSNLAHRLSSSCRMIGAVALGECCSRIERAGPHCSPGEMHRLMAQLEDALAHVMTRLSAHGRLQHSNAAD